MKNWLLALLGSLRARRADGAALERRRRELGRHVRQLRAAGAVARRVAGLGHEAGDHAMEGQAVVEALLGQRLDALDVLGREVRAQPDRDLAGLQFDDSVF